MSKTALYRHYNKDGDLLYVGISSKHLQRLAQHSNHAHWYDEITRIEIEHFEFKCDAVRAETKAIRTESPAHNILCTPRRIAGKRTSFSEDNNIPMDTVSYYKATYPDAIFT